MASKTGVDSGHSIDLLDSLHTNSVPDILRWYRVVGIFGFIATSRRTLAHRTLAHRTLAHRTLATRH